MNCPDWARLVKRVPQMADRIFSDENYRWLPTRILYYSLVFHNEQLVHLSS